MSVTVVSCVYGDYERFVPAWLDAVRRLEPAPTCVLKWSDPYNARLAWRHPQAWMLQAAISEIETDWVVISDIDDLLLPDALAGIEDVAADVWALGYERSDGKTYIPPPMTAADVLAATTSLIPAGSAIRTEAFRAVGGFRDVAFQDWALWRALARNGATFQSSDRAHFRYMRHDTTRSATELTADKRAEHVAEMMEAELAAV